MITFEPRTEEDGHRYPPHYGVCIPMPSFRLESKDSVFQARSPIIHISITNNILCCSTLKDSVCQIEFSPENNTFQAIISDPKPRLSTCHMVNEHQVMVADKGGDLVGLGGPGISTLFLV